MLQKYVPDAARAISRVLQKAYAINLNLDELYLRATDMEEYEDLPAKRLKLESFVVVGSPFFLHAISEL